MNQIKQPSTEVQNGSPPTPGQRFLPYRMFRGAFIPDQIMEYPDLSSTAKLMWGKLAQYAGKNGACWPSHRMLAENMGVSKGHIGRIIKELVDKKFIEKVPPSTTEKGQFKTTRYYFIWHECFNGSLPDQPTLVNEPPIIINDTFPTITDDNTYHHKRYQPAITNDNNLLSQMMPKENHIRESKKESLSGREAFSDSDKNRIIGKWRDAFGVSLPSEMRTNEYARAANYMLWLKEQGKLAVINNPVGYLAKIHGRIPEDWHRPTAPELNLVSEPPVSIDEQLLYTRALEEWDKLTESDKQGYVARAQDDSMVKAGKVSPDFFAQRLFIFDAMEEAENTQVHTC